MNYISKNFQINIQELKGRVVLTQNVINPIVHTSFLPRTLEVLQKRVPTIFDNKCYNGNGFSFGKESGSTEVGHLFEHLIIENLKLIAIKKCGKGDFKGETSWDWAKEKRGVFNIVVYSDGGLKKIFPIAFKKAVEVMEEIFDVHMQEAEV